MLVSGLVGGIVAGLLLGGRLERLSDLRLAWWPLLLVAAALRVALPWLDEVAFSGYLVAFAGIVAVAGRNRSISGMSLVAAGAGLNLVVVGLNGGMPVSASAAAAAGAVIPDDGLHHVLGPATALPFLADVLPLPLLRSVYSIGDVLIAAGAFWIPFSWMRRR